MCAHKCVCVPLHFPVGPRDPEFAAYRVQGYAWPHRLVFCICSYGYTKIALFFQGKNALLHFMFSCLILSKCHERHVNNTFDYIGYLVHQCHKPYLIGSFTYMLRMKLGGTSKEVWFEAPTLFAGNFFLR